MAHTGTTQHAEPHGSDGTGHEKRDVSLRPLVWGFISLVVLVLVSVVLMRVLLGYLVVREAETSPPVNPLAQRFGRQVPPEPRLQTDPLQELQAMHDEEDAVLSSYGWVDRKAGVVRIPIQRALELLAQRGLPARQQAPAAAGASE